MLHDKGRGPRLFLDVRSTAQHEGRRKLLPQTQHDPSHHHERQRRPVRQRRPAREVLAVQSVSGASCRRLDGSGEHEVDRQVEVAEPIW